MKNIFIGLLFAMLWASASVATKFGILSSPPLVLANIRFFLAGFVLLSVGYVFNKSYKLPTAEEWKHLAIFGLLNTTVYLGLYVCAMKYTAAGIGSLATSTNPLLIVLLSSWLIGRKPSKEEVFSIIIGMVGIGIATYPLLKDSSTTIMGVSLLMLSMVCVSFASVYYARIKWTLPNILINGWQVALGGVFLLPFTFIFSDFSAIQLDNRLIFSSFMAKPCCICCWTYLLVLLIKNRYYKSITMAIFMSTFRFLLCLVVNERAHYHVYCCRNLTCSVRTISWTAKKIKPKH